MQCIRSICGIEGRRHGIILRQDIFGLTRVFGDTFWKICDDYVQVFECVVSATRAVTSTINSMRYHRGNKHSTDAASESDVEVDRTLPLYRVSCHVDDRSHGSGSGRFLYRPKRSLPRTWGFDRIFAYKSPTREGSKHGSSDLL